MANGHENLIPVTERSKGEARVLGKIGGIKSGETRRKKKALKERLALAFDVLSKKVAKGIDDAEAKKIIEEEGYDVYILFKALNDPEANYADKLKAINIYYDRTEGKAKEFVEHSGSVDGTMNILVGDIKIDKE